MAVAFAVFSAMPKDIYVSAGALLVAWFAFLYLAYHHEGRLRNRVGFCLVATAILSVLVYRQIEDRKTSESISASVKDKPCSPSDVQYVPPAGKAVRFDGANPIPSEVLCPSHGMTDEQRRNCLCPRLLPYTLRSMEPPKESNFETEITISKTCDPIYKARLFFRDVYSQLGSIFKASPYMPPASKVLMTRGDMEFDRYSVLLSSSAPQDTITTSIMSAGGLRLICVNQEN